MKKTTFLLKEIQNEKKFSFYFFSIIFVLVCNLAFAELNLSNCFGIYNDNVIDLRENGINDNVVNGKPVRYTILDLKVGDVFIDVDETAKKVANITRNGNEINIETVTPTIDEVFQQLVIPNQEVDLTNKNIEINEPRQMRTSNGSFVTIEPKTNLGRGSSEKGMLGSIMKDACRLGITIAINLSDPIGSVAAKAEKEGKVNKGASKETWINLDLEVAHKVRKNVISPSFEYSKPTIKYKKIWFINVPYPSFTTGHGTIIADVDNEVGFSVEFTGKGIISQEIPFLGTPTNDGIYANLYLFPSGSFNASALYQSYSRTTYVREVGVEYVVVVPTDRVNKTTRNWSASGTYIEGAIQVNGEFMIGAKAGAKVAGFKVFEARIQGGPYVSAHVGADYANLVWDKGYEVDDSIWDFEKYKKFKSEWETLHAGDIGFNLYLSLGVKFNVNFVLLHFINWTPVSGQFKILEIGSHGNALFGESFGWY